jgi:patatin-like phospholipase
MDQQRKLKRRGFVMTGGGAKGLYEAGVINAFHLSGMEFDIITGSSIGAMNSIFFAEYLLRKKDLPSDIRADPEKAIEKMDDLIRCYHHTWLQMPTEKLIDDSDEGALSKLVKQLGDFRINLSDLVTLGWWLTDPKIGNLPTAQTGVSVFGTLERLVKALGNGSTSNGTRQLLRIYRQNSGNQERLREALRLYLRNLGLEFSVIPRSKDGKPGDDAKIEMMFTRKVLPLQTENLDHPITKQSGEPEGGDRLVDPNRTFKDFWDHGIDVRLTRANYRTGRLEVSSYVSDKSFIKYLKKQAWRLDISDSEKMPLGSFRLELPGNPNVIKAALASGRFPGVFAPFEFLDIYSEKDPENQLLYKLLSDEHWMSTAEVQDAMKNAYDEAFGEEAEPDDWANLVERWQGSESMRAFFPYPSDTYVDGGSIDNTPSNSAVDATREWIEAEGKSKRDVILELYIIFLDQEPRLPANKVKDPLLYEVVQRTLAIQSAAVKTSDAVVVNTINKYGDRAEDLARSLLAVLEGLELAQNDLSNEQVERLETRIRDLAPRSALRSQGRAKKSTLETMRAWAEDMLADKLPLHVDEVKIYPDKMSLSTLQFTERLGYSQKNAVEMITMGCYNTLATIRDRLENMKEREMDAQDEVALRLVRKWMSGKNGPDQDWRCARVNCAFYKNYCAHGLMEKVKIHS